MTRQLAGREILMANKYLKRCYISPIIMEMQIQMTILLYTHHLAKSESRIISSAGEDVGKLRFSCLPGDSVNLCSLSRAPPI